MDSLNEKIYRYLLSYGFSPVHKGFRLINDAIFAMSQKNFVYKSLGEIYRPLSVKYSLSVCSVQKNIKNAVDFASLNCEIEKFTKEFGALFKGGYGISCGVFLCYAANRLRYG